MLSLTMMLAVVLSLALPAPTPTAAATRDPPMPQGPLVDVYLANEQFINHALYFPVAGSSAAAEQVSMADNQLAWTYDGLLDYWDSQVYMGLLQPNPTGNCCLHSAPFDTGVLRWPVKWTDGACGFPRVNIPSGAYAKIIASADDMDCVQTFLRTLVP